MPLWYQNIRSALLLLQSVMGVLLFGYALKRRAGFFARAVSGLFAGGVFCWLLQSVIYIPGSAPLALASHALMSAVVYGILIAIVYFSCDETIWTVLFASSSGYIAQDVAGSLKQILRQIPLIEMAAQDNFGILGVDLLCYGGIYLILFIVFRPYTRDREENFDDKIKAVFSVIVLLLCIGMARLTQDNPDRNVVSAVTESLFMIIVDLLILALQFGVMERAKLAGHVEAMRMLMSQQRTQFEAHKQSMQLVNEKYHDLKHLLQDFEGKMPQKVLKKLEQSIDGYDLHADSGNSVLDVLLTEKMGLCAQRGINLTCCIGQTDFGFVDELDLYALFGNALGNAVNAVSALPEGRERFIILSASREGNMLTIHMENPFDGEIPFEDGLPQTAGDPDYHGFGMRSMARTAEKYGGMLAAKQEGGMFYLDILLLAPDGV